MRDFEYFIRQGIVKIRSPNNSLANDLIQESERKYNSLMNIIKKIGVIDENANDIIESSYDILLYLIRAKLLKGGFKSSGEGAHEAEISYLIKMGFSENEIRVMDELRYFRNRIKYYCKRFGLEYARKILGLLDKNYKRIKEIIS